jgi:hypothetical protein
MAFRSAIKTTPDSYTTNGDLAFSGETIGSHLMRLFTITRNAKGRIDETITNRLRHIAPKAFEEDPLLFTKMVFYKRDTRGGAGEKGIGQILFSWLWDNHNEIALKNFHLVPEYGYYKDYLQFLNYTDKHKIANHVAKIFADDLTKTTAILNNETFENAGWVVCEDKEDSEKKDSISIVTLGAKWAPTINGSHDKRFGISRKVAKCMGLPAGHWQKSYRKQLSAARLRIHVVERLMSTSQWDLIDLTTIPSVALHMYMKKCFPAKIPEKVKEYLANVASGEVQVKVDQLHPHEIIAKYTKGWFANSAIDDFTEEQWKAYVQKTAELGAFKNCIAVPDVSGSMKGVPLQVSLALSILISTLAGKPWDDMILTFSTIPKFFEFEKEQSLHDKVKQILSSGSNGLSTDVVAMFRLILRTGITKNLDNEDMPERLYIVSDMQFNHADTGSYLSSFQTVKNEFESAGYNLPELVYINVNGTNETFPVQHEEARVCMLSGSSPSVLKPLLSGKITNPRETMLDSLNQERYDQVTV